MRKMTDPISEWTLKECINALKRMDADLLEYGYAIYIADRIHDLTRWIPVSERMPTEEDLDEHGNVLASEVERESPNRRYQFMVKGDTIGSTDYFYTITHWRRITPPEGV
jgi:hypothetical protein